MVSSLRGFTRSNPVIYKALYYLLDCFVPRNDVNICHFRLFDCKSYPLDDGETDLTRHYNI